MCERLTFFLEKNVFCVIILRYLRNCGGVDGRARFMHPPKQPSLTRLYLLAIKEVNPTKVRTAEKNGNNSQSFWVLF